MYRQTIIHAGCAGLPVDLDNDGRGNTCGWTQRYMYSKSQKLIIRGAGIKAFRLFSLALSKPKQHICSLYFQVGCAIPALYTFEDAKLMLILRL